MKHTLILILLISFVAMAPAQLITGRFTTSFYGWQGRNENQDSTYSKMNYMQGYENIQLLANSNNYSLSTNFQFSKDFGSIISTNPDLRLSSLILKVRNIAGVGEIDAGRQFVFAGVGDGLMDGGVLKASLFDRMLGITAYGGYNVIQSTTIDLAKKFSDNALFGGQVTLMPADDGTIGLSFMKRIRRPEPYTAVRADSLFNPIVVIIENSPEEEEYGSIDARYSFLHQLNVYGRTDYDFLFQRLSRAQFYGRESILPSLAVTLEYIFREPRVAYNSIFSIFNVNSTKELEGGVEYEIIPALRTYARYATVNYSGDKSQRLTVGGSYEVVSISYTKNFGYAGDLNGLSVQAVYPMFERTIIPTIGFGYANYQLEENAPKNNVLSTSVGVTYRPLPAFSTDMIYQFMRNPLYSNDNRIFLKVNYWFANQLGLL
jgi:hypothetical protein